MPASIIILYALVIGAFVADQLSSFMDAHWQIAEFSISDPWYIGMTIFWGLIVTLILFCIKCKHPSTPKAFLYLGFVCIVFLILVVLDSTQPVSDVFFSYQALEVLIWFICYAMSKYNKVLKAWFAPTDPTDLIA
jgi:hypothetical protein